MKTIKDKELEAQNEKITLISNPELSEWKCYLFGTDNHILVPKKENEPNWFWRKMQYFILGNKWVKE